jgi:hypothetical protein
MLSFFSGSSRSEQKEHQCLVPCVHRKSSFFMKFWDWKVSLLSQFGWQTRFKQRYSICEIAVQEEKLSAIDAAVGCYAQCISGMVFHESSNAG